MNEPSTALLLSIRPHFADLIVAGEKTVELRRQNTRTAPGSLVLMYSASPVCAIVGAFVLDDVVRDTPRALWRRVGSRAAVSRGHYEAYYRGAALAVALVVGETWTLPSPVGLDALRAAWPGFHPPQSFRYACVRGGRSSLRIGLDDLSVSIPVTLVPSAGTAAAIVGP